jgi:hypothetical protein
LLLDRDGRMGKRCNFVTVVTKVILWLYLVALKMISSRICACVRNIVFKTNHIIIITWSMTFCTSNIKKHGVARSDK